MCFGAKIPINKNWIFEHKMDFWNSVMSIAVTPDSWIVDDQKSFLNFVGQLLPTT